MTRRNDEPSGRPAPTLQTLDFQKGFLEFKGKANGVFALGHGLIGKLSQPAFQPGFDQSPDALYVHNGWLM
jgi:hypothetical protein